MASNGPIPITRGDTAAIRVQLRKRGDDGQWTIPDFTGASVRLVVVDALRSWVVSIPATFEDVAQGIVAGFPTPTQFPGSGVTPGWIQAEVTFADGSIESYPKGPDRFPVVIDDDFD